MSDGTLRGVTDDRPGGLVDDEPSGHRLLDFNAPLSDARAGRLVASLGPLAGARVVDLGCGWAEMLLRVLAAEPTARGLGVDEDPEAVDRGTGNARVRGLADRVRLEVGDVTDTSTRTDPADVVLCIGASHAWGGTRAMLDAVRSATRQGGRALVGDGIWERPPGAVALAALDASADEFASLSALVDLAMESGFRVLAVSVASLDEWDDFESRWCAGRERWLLDHPGHPDAGEVRRVVDQHRRAWLHGYRGVLGFAYLTLALPGAG